MKRGIGKGFTFFVMFLLMFSMISPSISLVIAEDLESVSGDIS